MANPWDNDPIIKPAAATPMASAQANPWDNDPIVRPAKQDGSVSAENVIRSTASGVPIVGGVLNKLNAATNALLAPAVDPLLPDSFQKLPGETFDERYNQAFAIQEGKDQAFDEQHPYLDTGLGIAGGVAAMAPVAATAIGGRALGVTGETMLGRSVAGAASGSAINGTDAAIRSDGDLVETGKGAGLGFLMGMGSPVVGAAIGSGARRVLDWVRRPGQSVERNIASSLAADGIDEAAARARLADLGPQGMIADLGPNLQGDLSAIATMPGRGQTVSRSALQDRSSGAGGRIRSDADATLGPAGDIVADRAAFVQQRADAAAPLYERAYSTPLQQTPAMGNILKTPAGKQALRNAQRTAENEMMPIDPDALDVRGLDLIKRSMDDQISVAKRAGKNNEVRVLTSMKNKLIEDAPDTYRAALDAYSGPSAMIDALDDGRTIFQRNVHAGEVRAEMQKLTGADREAYTQGARSALEEMMTNARNAPGEVRGQFQKEANRAKLYALLGSDEANRFLTALERETTFAGTHGAATGNSVTAARQAAQQRWGSREGDAGPVIAAMNLNFGDAVAAAGGRLNRVQNEALMATRRGRGADILTAQGDDALRQLQNLSFLQQLQAQNGQIGAGIGNAAQVGIMASPPTFLQRLERSER